MSSCNKRLRFTPPVWPWHSPRWPIPDCGQEHTGPIHPRPQHPGKIVMCSCPNLRELPQQNHQHQDIFAKTQRTPIMGFQIKMWLAFSLAVIGVKVKIFHPKSRKNVSNHFLFYKKSSKMQFSMILAKLKNLSLFYFSHFGCYTLYSARHYSEMAFSALL